MLSGQYVVHQQPSDRFCIWPSILTCAAIYDCKEYPHNKIETGNDMKIIWKMIWWKWWKSWCFGLPFSLLIRCQPAWFDHAVHGADHLNAGRNHKYTNAKHFQQQSSPYSLHGHLNHIEEISVCSYKSLWSCRVCKDSIGFTSSSPWDGRIPQNQAHVLSSELVESLPRIANWLSEWNSGVYEHVRAWKKGWKLWNKTHYIQ